MNKETIGITLMIIGVIALIVLPLEHSSGYNDIVVTFNWFLTIPGIALIIAGIYFFSKRGQMKA